MVGPELFLTQADDVRFQMAVGVPSIIYHNNIYYHNNGSFIFVYCNKLR